MNELQKDIKSKEKKNAKMQHVGLQKMWKKAEIVGAITVAALIGIGGCNTPTQKETEQLASEYKEAEIQQYEETKKEFDELNVQTVNIAFMQKVYDLMAAEDYEAMREIADSEETVTFVTEMGEESCIYIPEDNTSLNGTGAGVYKDDEDDYYFFYGNYVNGERTGQGTSYMKISEEDKMLYYFEGIYRVFTGEWKNDAPNGYGREEFVYSNCDDYAEQLGNVVSEGNLKEGLWDGEIKCEVYYSLKNPVLVEFEMDGSYILATGVPAEEGAFIPGNEDYPGIYTFRMAVLYDESGKPHRWIDGYLDEGDAMGTIGYGDIAIDEIMEGFAVLQ